MRVHERIQARRQPVASGVISRRERESIVDSGIAPQAASHDFGKIAIHHQSEGAIQRKDEQQCGPGTADPFCLGISDTKPCTPFASLDHAFSVWADLSTKVPNLTAAVTRCGEVKAVWQEYFAGTSSAFAFSNSGSCVVEAAKTDKDASEAANRGADGYFKDIIDQLPVTLRGVTPSPFSLGGAIAELRLPLEDAIGPHGKRYLHPDLTYNTVSNAAANLAGGMGIGGQGSDIFGDDDREMGGTVIVQVTSIDPLSGEMIGEVRWQPTVHVKDTVDFCPGNLGTQAQREFTVPMSKLEAMGLTRDVPITIDYSLDVRQSKFRVAPLVGPLPPKPGPNPKPNPTAFPRSGPARTTGSLLRVRTGPGLKHPALRLIGERGTPIQVITQERGDSVDGNDVWDRIKDGYVSDRYVAFDE